MSKQPINTLKQWFISKAKPLSVQFWHWMDSYWHKDEQIPSASIDGLQELLDAKLDKNAAVDPDQVGPYDPLKNYVYDAQLAEYVSFSNPASSNPQFMVEGFYRLLEDAPAGENPETHPQHWAYQGYQIGDITIADVIGLREELDTLKYANGILLPNPETQSLSGIATNVAAALDELRSATIAIRDAVRRLAGAACTIEADPVPQAVGTTPTLFDFTTTYPSTNTDVLTVDDTANKLGAFLNGRWQFSTYIAVQNTSAQDRILYLRIINDDTDAVLSSRPVDVPKNSIVIPPLATAPFDVVAAPHSISLEFLADGVGVSVLSLETTLTTSGGNTSAAAGLPSTWEANKAAIRAITGYQHGIDVGDYETGAIYEFDSTLTAADDNDTYLTPGDIIEPAPGRWIKRKVFSVSGHTHVLSTITPDAGNANKIPVVSPDGLLIGYTAFTFDQIVQLAQVDMSDVNVGEKKILLAEKLADGSPSFTGAIAQLDKLGPSSLDALLEETNAAWDGDEITIIGDNQNGALGENSQEYRIGSDFFLCISHSYGTDATNGSATWVRNRGQDSLTPGITHDDAIIVELETETGWSGADFKQITSKSKKGSWYKAATGGYLYLCIDKNNGWQRHGVPPTADIEISSASHPTLTTNLAAHDFATNGMYDESSDGTNEAAEQAQEWWDTSNNVWYKRNMNGFWAKMI
jgi:hypothetical protein